MLLTTQYLDEADQLADRIVIIDHGSVIADGTPDELKSLAGRDVVEVQLRDASSLHDVAQALRTLGAEEPSVDTATRRVSVSVAGGTEPLMAAARVLDERGVDVDNLALASPDARRGLPLPHRPRRRGLTNGALMSATLTIAKRTIYKFMRTPQLIVVGTIQGAMFLLIFRYVFGGAIDGGSVPYVDFLVPGFITTTVLFAGMSASAGVAEDVEQGFLDRLRSLPIPRGSVLAGRALGETVLLVWMLAVTTAIGFAVGFRLHGSIGQALGGVRALHPLRLRVQLALRAARPRRRQRGRPRRGCRCSCSRSSSSRARTCAPTRCPAGCAGSPSTSRSLRWSTRCAR